MKVLLAYPAFPGNSFWDYRSVCRLGGAKYPATPLGLITVAGQLPAPWELRLVDMNADPLRDEQIDWADVVFASGMLPQQRSLLRLMDRVHARGRRVAVGGPEPTSQPDLYHQADYLLSGESEGTIAPLIEDLERGVPGGRYVAGEKPDLSTSPLPRFDLLNFSNYLMVGIQFSRGCPYNCEFCDVIELYGRTPRMKSPEQIIAELDALRRLGYRGHVDFVDDNFIGNRARARELLAAVRDWSRTHRHPFFFSTEASLNLADDAELLRLMEETDFRYVFVGIESADQEALKAARKSQNVGRSIVEDLREINRHGIVVNGGFILGFDNETRASARQAVETIEAGGIPMAMVGLLSALPKTQLTRRLAREGRMTSGDLVITSDEDTDQTTSGINFEPLRPRVEILEDFCYVIETIYADRPYFDRVLRTARTLRLRPKHRPHLRELSRLGRALLRLVRTVGLRSWRAWYFWRNVAILLVTRPSSLEPAVSLMAMHLHFAEQTRNAVRVAARKMEAEHRRDVRP